MKNRKKGFTLIEMIVVIAILAVLSIAIIPLINNLIDKSRVSRFLADADTIRTAALTLQADIGTLDDTIFVQNSTDIRQSTLFLQGGLGKWDGPYIEEGVDTHPWGGLYGIDFAEVDGVAAPPNNAARIDDLFIRATNVDAEGELTPVPLAGEIINELNKKITGTDAVGGTARAVINGTDEVDLVVLSNVSE